MLLSVIAQLLDLEENEPIINSSGSRHFRAIQFYFKTKVNPVRED
jgi:predicted secreted Zn-dependent protease